jgi:hypothetical protein
MLSPATSTVQGFRLPKVTPLLFPRYQIRLSGQVKLLLGQAR